MKKGPTGRGQKLAFRDCEPGGLSIQTSGAGFRHTFEG